MRYIKIDYTNEYLGNESAVRYIPISNRIMFDIRVEKEYSAKCVIHFEISYLEYYYRNNHNPVKIASVKYSIGKSLSAEQLKEYVLDAFEEFLKTSENKNENIFNVQEIIDNYVLDTILKRRKNERY